MILKFSVFCAILLVTSADYWSDREALINLEESQMIGSNTSFTDLEEQANTIITYLKQSEFDKGFEDPSTFLPGKHFFHARKEIEASQVFQILQKLPKGASLHSHDTAMVSGEFLYNLTFKENLYGCTGQNGRLSLKFFNQPDDACSWALVSDLRSSNSSFDTYLKTQINIIVDDPNTDYKNINDVWNKFVQTFITIHDMLTYRPVWEEYFYQVLKELYEDNVMYVEFRTTLPNCYDLNGTTYGPVDVAGITKLVVDKFVTDFPDFQGGRIIYAPVRAVDNGTVDAYVKTALELRDKFGDFMAGFDLVGQEDLGRPLDHFMGQLQQLKDAGIKLIFHAGETNWYGSSTDLNLVDAVLLGTVRIGHGYALAKHPEVMKLVKERGIAIEISPISNQVLKLVSDYRNHPANYLIANNFPVVITNDDPAFWGARALSYDWYMAFMGMSSRSADLKFLKQLALNSYRYSVMAEDERTAAIEQWNVRWNSFIQLVLTKCIEFD